MKIKLGILTALLFMSSIVLAQIRYSYDASGVRVKAHLDVEKIEDNQHDAAEMVIDTTLQNTIDIYPNPAINLLTIKPKSDLEYKVQIYDFSGKKQIEKNINNTSDIYVGNLAIGTYMLVIESNGRKASWKVIKSE
jgi:hypothetical protein